MAQKTASQLKATLEAITTFPYPIRFYTTKQKFPIYPYCEILKTQSQSTDENVTDITKTDGFSLTLYVRYIRDFETEEANQTTIENLILTALEGFDFGASKLFMETKRWNRQALQRPFGSSSTIVISIIDRASTSGDGVLGAEMSLTIGHGSTNTVLKVLSLKEDIGPAMTSHYDDTRKRFVDPDNFNEGEFTLEYENTSTIETEIDGYRDSGNTIACRLTKKNTNKDFNGVFGATSRTGQYDKIERAVTKIYLIPS